MDIVSKSHAQFVDFSAAFKFYEDNNAKSIILSEICGELRVVSLLTSPPNSFFSAFISAVAAGLVFVCRLKQGQRRDEAPLRKLH